MGKYCVKPNDSLWVLAGGDSAKYEMLIECNCQHPNIKNRKRDDPYFGWLDTGECIEIPWKQDDDLGCILQEALAALDIYNGDGSVDKPCSCRECALHLQLIDL